MAEQSQLSSLHVLFPDEHEAALMADAGMLMRHGVQFHWTNPGYESFEAFLATLSQKKRKNIRAERRRVAEAGISFRQLRGAEIGDDEWRFFHRCYRQTYREHHSTPYLNLDFFRRIGAAMPENLLLVVAVRAGQPIAASLVVYDGDPARSTLFGRYWGAVEHHPCLHFETAYYQPPLEFCIAQGIRTFEGGAQGEHKMARGFPAGRDPPPPTGWRIRPSPMPSSASSCASARASTPTWTNSTTARRLPAAEAGHGWPALPLQRHAPQRVVAQHVVVEQRGHRMQPDHRVEGGTRAFHGFSFRVSFRSAFCATSEGSSMPSARQRHQAGHPR
ncbi:GNAT family N-acetyltransferase [Cupriavidus basilensis]